MGMTANPQRAAAPIGIPFSQLYSRPAALLADSPALRLRLGGYINRSLEKEIDGLVTTLKVEGGMKVPHSGYRWDFEQFFEKASLGDVLTAITLVWRFLTNMEEAKKYLGIRDSILKSKDWREFVARAFEEQAVGYSVDEHCGVHYFVDAEFQRNLVSVVAGLGHHRYQAVKAALDDAQGYLEAVPNDTKAAVRSAFEAMEILGRLMVPAARNLNKGMIEREIKPLMLQGVTEPTDIDMIGKMMDGFGQLVDSIHLYRHGQGVQVPIAPPVEVAVYVLSSSASLIRWMAGVDAKIQGI